MILPKVLGSIFTALNWCTWNTFELKHRSSLQYLLYYDNKIIIGSARGGGAVAQPGGQSASLTLLTGKFLETYREKRQGKKENEEGKL